MNGLTPGLDRSPPPRWMGGQGGQSLKVFGRTRSFWGLSSPKIEMGGKALKWLDQGQTIAVVDKQAVCDKLSNIYSGSVSDVLTAAELSDRIPEEIPALVSGTVCYLAKSGELIDAGADIARVGGKGALVLNVAVPERNLSKIRKGQTALLTLSSVDGKFAGQVKSIGKSTRKQYLGAVEETVADVMISIESPSDKLKSGDSGYAEIQTGLKRDIVTLPYSAVMQDEKSEYIYVIENGRTTRRDVITGLELAKRTQVFGVSVEEEVVKSTQGVAANSIIIRNISRDGKVTKLRGVNLV